MHPLLAVPFALLTILAVPPAEAEAAELPPEDARTSRSPGLALGLSIALPALGYGTMAVSALPSGHIQSWQEIGMAGGAILALLGPSGGHLYTGHAGRAMAFSGGRLLLTILGFVAFDEGMQHDDRSEADYDHGAVRASMIEVGLCAAGILALSIWESIDTYYSARARGQAPRRDLALAPLLVGTRGGASVAGLAVVGAY